MKTLLAVAVTLTTIYVGNPERHRTIEEHYSTTPSQRIEMRGFSGSRIKFRSWDKNEVSVRLEISFSSSDARDEQKYLDDVTLKQTQSDERLRIEYQEPDVSTSSTRSFWTWLGSVFSGSFTSKEIEGEIYVPRSNPLSAEVKYGSVEMDGMKGEVELLGRSTTISLRDCSSLGEVSDDYGKVTIENSGGSLHLSSKSATIIVDRFAGKATINADYSNITARDLTQSLSILSKSGTIRVDHVGGDLSIRSDYSNVSVNTVSGFVDIQSKSGKIRAMSMDGIRVDADYTSMDISDVSGKSGKDIVLSGRSGSIFLTDSDGNVQIDDPYGTINLKGLRGNVKVTSRSSKVVASDVTGDWSSVSEYCTMSLREMSAKSVSITNSSGQIEVALKTVPSFVDIKNTYATVNLVMPTGFSGDVDLNVSYGKIETNLPLEKTKSFNGGGAYAMGKIGSGNGKISIETRSASINVMQR